MKYRSLRLVKLIKTELSNIFLRELELENSLITIEDVELSENLSEARIKLAVFPESKSQEVLKVLKRKRSFFQDKLTRKLNIKPMPRIKFFLAR